MLRYALMMKTEKNSEVRDRVNYDKDKRLFSVYR